MRLKAINVFSDYLGDEKQTKERTKELRKESDFLHNVFCDKIGYIENDFLKQLNISCSPSIKEICIRQDYLAGYPTIAIPFDYLMYCELDDKEKADYWTDRIIEIFCFLKPKMNCKEEKMDLYIDCLKKN